MKILVLANNDVGLYNFRLELIENLIRNQHSVFISCPYGDRIEAFKDLGASCFDVSINRHGMNPFQDMKLIGHYKKIIKKIHPDIILSYTIKPNIYGAIAAKPFDIPFVANITGLGTAVESKGFKSAICVLLYKYAFRRVKKVFFQNTSNRDFFVKHKIAIGKHDLLPGSGVNLEKYKLLPYPPDGIIKFVFVGRIMKEKGIDEYLRAAEIIKKKTDNVEFHICGFIEKEYDGSLDRYIDNNVVIYHGMVRNMIEVYKQMHCTVFPSFYPEGISNVLLESAACGRPIITTNRPGCQETVDTNITGFLIRPSNTNDLVFSIETFLKLSYKEKKMMGINSRNKIEREFDRKLVVDKYLHTINSLTNKEQ